MRSFLDFLFLWSFERKLLLLLVAAATTKFRWNSLDFTSTCPSVSPFPPARRQFVGRQPIQQLLSEPSGGRGSIGKAAVFYTRAARSYKLKKHLWYTCFKQSDWLLKRNLLIGMLKTSVNYLHRIGPRGAPTKSYDSCIRRIIFPLSVLCVQYNLEKIELSKGGGGKDHSTQNGPIWEQTNIMPWLYLRKSSICGSKSK